MISLQTSDEIIKLRATGYSYEVVARRTGVSKPTVMGICRTRQDEITDLRKNALDEVSHNVRKAVSRRLTNLTLLSDLALEELLSRDLSELDIKTLLYLVHSNERSMSLLKNTNPVIREEDDARMIFSE